MLDLAEVAVVSRLGHADIKPRVDRPPLSRPRGAVHPRPDQPPRPFVHGHPRPSWRPGNRSATSCRPTVEKYIEDNRALQSEERMTDQLPEPTPLRPGLPRAAPCAARKTAARRDAREPADEEALATARRAVDLASDKKASDIVLLEIRGLTTLADYFVICSGAVRAAAGRDRRRHRRGPARGQASGRSGARARRTRIGCCSTSARSSSTSWRRRSATSTSSSGSGRTRRCCCGSSSAAPHAARRTVGAELGTAGSYGSTPDRS